MRRIYEIVYKNYNIHIIYTIINKKKDNNSTTQNARTIIIGYLELSTFEHCSIFFSVCFMGV